MIAIPRHPHPSTLKSIEVTGKENYSGFDKKWWALSYEQYISHFDFQFSDDTLSYADKENNQPRQDEVVKIYDNMFILRVVLSLLLGLVALIVGTYTLLKHFCEQRYAEPVGRSKLVGWKELISLFTVYHQVFQLKNCMKYIMHSFWRINNILLQINSWA